MKVLFNRETLNVTGVDREELAYEMSLDNVPDIPDTFSKMVSYMVEEQKVNEEGRPFYYFQPPDSTVTKLVDVKVETIEDTDDPVIEKVFKKVPLMRDGVQVEYEQTTIDEEGNTVGTGVMIPCFITEEVEVQKENEEGKPLFYKTIKDEVTEIVSYPVEEITDTDERYSPYLPPVMETLEKTKTVTFKEYFHEFSYEEILAYKYQDLLDNSQMDYLLVETFPSEASLDLTYENHSGNIGVHKISLPPGGKVKTVKYQLERPTSKVTVLDFQAGSGVDIRHGNKIINGEYVLSSPVSEIAFIITNTSDNYKDITAFAIGY